MKYFGLLVFGLSVLGQDVRLAMLSEAAISSSLRTNILHADAKIPNRDGFLPRWHLPGHEPDITGGGIVHLESVSKHWRKLDGGTVIITQKHSGWSEVKTGLRFVWQPTVRFSAGVQYVTGRLGQELWTFVRFQ